MTKRELKRCKAFLKFFAVPIDKDYIPLTDGGNSCIMNMKTKWQEFLGYSINSVAEAVAREMGKPTKWTEE